MKIIHWLFLVLLVSLPALGDDVFRIDPDECRKAGLPPITLKAKPHALNSYHKLPSQGLYATFSTPPGAEEYLQVAFVPSDRSVSDLPQTLFSEDGVVKKGKTIRLGEQELQSFNLVTSRKVRYVVVLQPYLGEGGGNVAIVFEVPRNSNFEQAADNSVYQDFLKELEIRS